MILMQEVPCGDWFAPGSDTRLGTYFAGGDMFQSCQPQVVHLCRRRTTVNGPTGIYYCVIATSATHNGSERMVHVGLYASGGVCVHII